MLLLIQTTLNVTGARVMGRVAQFGVYVEILGTLGLAVVLAIHGFHHGLGYLFTTQGVQHVKTSPLGLDFGGSYFGALLIAVLAPVYIFYGFGAVHPVPAAERHPGLRAAAADLPLLLLRHVDPGGGIAADVLLLP
ncbi:MAG TPA: hypothetical protein VF838_17015 [Trebonia sp.]